VLGDVVRRATRLTYGKRRGLVRLHGDLDLACVTDGDRLLQILVNLLQNASDASEQAVDVTLSRAGTRVVVVRLKRPWEKRATETRRIRFEAS
jgi:C4-dicarboxylate-specific signal transduction histidine kinase